MSPPRPPPAPVSPEAPADVAIPSSQQNRQVIFNGHLTLEVADPDVAEASIRAAIDAAKGWIHRIRGAQFTLRVPAAGFHALLVKLSALGRVLDRRVEGSDVTEELRDARVRVESAEKVLARLLALLEKARDVEEALAIEREIARVAGALEGWKARLLDLSEKVAFSTLEVELRPPAPVAAPRPARNPRFPFSWLRDLDLNRLTQLWEF